MNNQISKLEPNQPDFDESLDDPRQALYARTSSAVAVIDKPITKVVQAGADIESSSAYTKKLVAVLNKAFLHVEKAKKNYVFSVINLGEKLLEARETVGFGKWESFVNDNSELSFGRVQASKYMQIARHKTLVLTFFNDQGRLSVNQLTKAISGATPEQMAKAKELELIEQEASLKPVAATSQNTKIKGTKEKDTTLGKGAVDGVIDGEFTEISGESTSSPTSTSIKPEQPIDESELEELRDLVQELQSMSDELVAENEQMHKVFDSDDHTSAALTEIERHKSMYDDLKRRFDGLLSEKNEAIKSVKYWQKKFIELEKKGGGNE